MKKEQKHNHQVTMEVFLKKRFSIKREKKKEETKENNELAYVEKQTPGMHTQRPGTSGDKRGQHRIAQGSSVYIEQCKK